MVPELDTATFSQYQTLEAIAKRRNLTIEQVKQLPYNDAMLTIATMHHQNRYSYYIREFSKPAQR